MSQLWAVGDIHNQFYTVLSLMDQLVLNHDLNPREDTLVFLGDYVDGGKYAVDTLKWVKELSEDYPHWQFLRGNHEQMLLDAAYLHQGHDTFDNWYDQGGMATWRNFAKHYYGNADPKLKTFNEFCPADILEWIRRRPHMHETEDFYFVHAGFRPGVHKADQNNHDMLWIRDDFYMIGHDFGKPVVFGHTVFDEPFMRYTDDGKLVAIGIDTMIRKTKGPLTAVNLTDPRNLYFVQQEPVLP